MSGFMEAAVVGAVGEPADVVVVRDVLRPTPGPGQLLLRVHATALGFPDVLLCRGQYQNQAAPPFVPGSEVCGTVVAPRGSDLAGQRVAALLPGGLGGAARFACAESHQVFPVPDRLSDAQAASLPSAYLTAWLALHHRGGLREGETLVVAAAAGGVGSAAVQLGIAAGARVVAVTRGSKLAVARELGAHAVIDAAAGSLTDQVRDATGPGGADVVFDPVGGETYHALARTLGFGGRALIVGFAGGEIQTARLNRPLLSSTSIIGVNCGLHVQREPRLVRRAMSEIAALAETGQVTPLVDGVIPISEAADGLQRLADGVTVGRVVLTPAAPL